MKTRVWTACSLGLLLATAVPARAFAQERVPRPEELLGFRPGEDYKLADYDQMLQYFRAVDASSDRVQLQEIGLSSMGRPMVMAIVTSPENFGRLDRYQEISRRLATARGLSEEQARAMAAEGKAVIYIDSGLHATEVGHAQHSFELIYHLAADSSPSTQEILDNVILLLLPCVNPDGMDLVVNWYERNLGSPYEVSPLPQLSSKYVGHDNNRDWFMFTQTETRNIGRVIYHQWLPQIVYNHHQGVPFPARIFIPPFDGPMNPHIPPLVMRGIQLIGSSMARAFAEQGKSGVVSRMVYDTWWNGGLRTSPYFHNMIGILTETALHKYATPKFYAERDLPESFPDGTSAKLPSTFYPDPWRGGWWRLREAIDYMMTASLALLEVGARDKEKWLYGIYRMGRDSIDKGKNEPPYAFIIPADQSDPNTAVKLVNTLRAGAVETWRAASPFWSEGTQYPAGSYVFLASQPFRPYLVDLLMPQNHPDQKLDPGGPPETPYDVAGWTLPLAMGVRSVAALAPFEARLEPIEQAGVPGGGVEGSGRVYLLDPRVNDSFIAVNRLLKQGASVYRSTKSVGGPSDPWPAGTFLVAGGRGLDALARELGIRVRAVSKVGGEGLRIESPRVALYKSWVANADEGWNRWLFEQFEFPYQSIHDAEMKAAGLSERYNVIVLPESPLKELVEGHERGSVPPEYAGGIGSEGVDRLRQFVSEGGTLVCLDSATELPIEYFDIPVESALKGIEPSQFYCPGSLLEIEFDPAHPLAYGMGGTGVGFFRDSRVYNLIPDFESQHGQVAAKFPDRNPLLSGWILGDEYIRRKAAVVDMPYG
ncbi:MAG TPA: M14 metallopeptidase family protein, partial [Vicinamibacteria bacterium]|nr:M14 metallopeptidase family protein [Vicinamibacteria bacterium]